MNLLMNPSPPKFWKILFLVAGLVNGLAGCLGMVFPSHSLKFASGIEITEPSILFVFFMLCFVVALFGLGYFMVAFNAVANRGLVVVGAIAKISFPAIVLYGYLNGMATLEFMVLIVGDLAWAGLFIHFLRTSKKTLDSLEISA
jgi:hypothetical protein